MRRIETEGGVALHAVVEAAAEYVGGNAVEDEIAERIWLEMHRTIAGEVSDLQIGIGELLLQGDDVVEVPLELALIEVGGIEVANAKGSELGRLPRVVGDLVVLDRDPTDRGEPRASIQQRGGIAERSALQGLVVDCIDGGYRIFKAQIGEEAATREEVFRAPACPAVLDAGRQCRAVAAIDADRATRVLRTAARLNVDEPTGTQTVLCRKSAGDERQAADKTGLKQLSEARYAVRDDDAVDPVLEVGVLIADMQAAAGGGIHRHAWRLQEHLVERRVRPLRQRLDVLAANLVVVDADLG